MNPADLDSTAAASAAERRSTACGAVPQFDSEALFCAAHPLHPASLERLREAVTHTGFLKLRGTAPAALQTPPVLRAYADFFALPTAQKAALDMSLTDSNRGWGHAGSEQVNAVANADYKEFFDSGVELPDGDWRQQMTYYYPNRWPAMLPQFRSVLLAYYHSACHLALQVLHRVLEVIGVPAAHFKDAFRHPMALLRGNYYPPRSTTMTALDYGIAPHTDYGCLTLLVGDGSPGLEIQTLDGQWIEVTTGLDEMVVNFGEMLTLWTSNQVRATPHRVIGLNQPRYSVVLFFNPDHDTAITADGSVLAGEYLSRRYDQTYTHRQHKTAQQAPHFDF